MGAAGMAVVVPKTATRALAKGAEELLARMAKGDVFRWKAASNKSTSGRITINAITANKQNNTNSPSGLMLNEPTRRDLNRSVPACQ